MIHKVSEVELYDLRTGFIISTMVGIFLQNFLRSAEKYAKKCQKKCYTVENNFDEGGEQREENFDIFCSNIFSDFQHGKCGDKNLYRFRYVYNVGVR